MTQRTVVVLGYQTGMARHTQTGGTVVATCQSTEEFDKAVEKSELYLSYRAEEEGGSGLSTANIAKKYLEGSYTPLGMNTK